MFVRIWASTVLSVLKWMYWFGRGRRRSEMYNKQCWYCNKRIVCRDLKLCSGRVWVVRLIVCCCDLEKREIDCECESAVVKDVLTEVGWCLHVAVFRVGSFAQALNANRCLVPWRSFNAVSSYWIRVMSRVYGMVCYGMVWYGTVRYGMVWYGITLVLQGVSVHNKWPSKAHWFLHIWPGLALTNSTFCPLNVFMCFVWVSEQTAIISLYNFKWLVFITETECVYCAVRTEYSNIIKENHALRKVYINCGYVSCSAPSFMNQVRMLVCEGWPLPAPYRYSLQPLWTHSPVIAVLIVCSCCCLQLKIMSEL
jgi:hypothetical protein